MPQEETLKSLDPRIINQVNSVRRAIDQGDMDYAVDVCTSILTRHPGCVEVRRLLHTAQKPCKAKGLLKWIVDTKHYLCVAYGALWLSKTPLKSLALGQRVLCSNIENRAALRLLGRAAESLSFDQTAIMAYEAIQNLDPLDLVNAIALGNAYLRCDEPAKAVELGQKALEMNPAHQGVQDLLKAASVALSLKRGSWEDTGQLNPIKEEKSALLSGVTLRERFSREKLLELIEQAKEAIAAQPGALEAYRMLASYCAELGTFDEALASIKEARIAGLLSDGDDAELARLEADLVLKQMGHLIAETEAALRVHPQDETLRRKLERAKIEETNYRFKQAQAKVDQYPNEGAYRFELGVLLYQRGELDLAIRQFQRSQHSAKVHIESLLYLGRAYKAKTFFDLAIEQLQLAQSEAPVMNELKKDITYDLASCYELTGDKGKAIAEYKIIYAADINYRDVAERINLHYSTQ